jgi:hypothetical protein
LSNYKLGYIGDEINTRLGYVTQNMAIGASPTLTGLTLSGLTANRLIYTNGSKAFTSAFTTDGNYIYSTGLKVGRDADNYIDWTTDNQLTIRCNATNYIFTPTTLSYLDDINQQLTTTSSPTFASGTKIQTDQNNNTDFLTRNDTNGTAAKSRMFASFGNYSQYIGIAQYSPNHNTSGLITGSSSALYSEGSTNGLRVFTYDSARLIFGTGNSEKYSISSGGNHLFNLAASETSQVGGMCIKQGTDPTTQTADQISIFATAGANCTLGIGTEQAIASESPTADRTLIIKINGALYKLCLEYISGE